MAAIITVTVRPTGLSYDLELPTELPAAELARLLAELLLPEGSQPGGPPRLEAHALGRLLAPDESLAEAGLWDGAWLSLDWAG